MESKKRNDGRETVSAVDLDAVMNGLKPFQQDAVHHVSNLFYGSESAEHPGKFLIGDC